MKDMKAIKYLKNTYFNWTPVVLLWKSSYLSGDVKIVGTLPMVFITPFAWVLCTMYLIVLILIIVPLAWGIWLFRKLTKKRRRNTNKYTF